MTIFCRLLLALVTCSFCARNVSADGDLSVSVRNGNLRIIGGRAVEQLLKITPTSTPNRYMVASNTGTTLNGVNPLFVEGITGNIDIRLSASETIVVVSDGLFDQIEIGGNLNINTSSPDSTIVMLDTVVCYENISVTTGRGADVVMMGYSGSQGSTTIRTGSGDDTVFGLDCFPSQDLFVDCGSGNDIVMFDELRSNEVLLRGGSGSDSLGISNELDKLSIEYEYDGGAGTDTYLHYSHFEPTLRRMEGSYPGSFDDLFDDASSGDSFYAATLLWALLGLDE